MTSRTVMTVYGSAHEHDVVQIRTQSGHIAITVDDEGEVTIATEGVNLANVRVLDEQGDTWRLDPKIVHLHEEHDGGMPDRSCTGCHDAGFFPVWWQADHALPPTYPPERY